MVAPKAAVPNAAGTGPALRPYGPMMSLSPDVDMDAVPMSVAIAASQLDPDARAAMELAEMKRWQPDDAASNADALCARFDAQLAAEATRARPPPRLSRCRERA